MARVAPSYLSRVETGRVQPTVRTLGRIASALGVPLAALLADGGGHGCRHPPCPVTTSGECLLDLIRPAAEPATGQESYTPRQTRLLRRVGAWLRTLDEEAVAAVEILVGRALAGREPRLGGAGRARPGRATASRH